MHFGWSKKTLRINLSRRSYRIEDINDDFIKKYIGGRGFNSRILYDEVKPKINPFSSDNKLLISIGPLNGTLSPGSSRFTITAKSPLTGIHGDGNCGGSFGSEMRYAGLDTIIIEGRSDKPVILLIDEQKVDFRDGTEYWGMTTWETETAIKKDEKDSELSVISIGPAGENLVKYAVIINDFARSAGRGGIGAVMGSKKLKAIAIRGNKDVAVYDSDLLEELVLQAYEALQKDENFYYIWSKYGTPGLLDIYGPLGVAVCRNFQSGITRNAEKISGEELIKYSLRSISCFSCPITCSHFLRIDKGLYKGTFCEGMQYGSLVNLGIRSGIDDIEAIIYFHSLASQFGIDVTSLGSTISFAIECYEKGYIDKSITEMQLKWGDPEMFSILLHDIAYRRGFGDILAEGTRHISKIIGKDCDKFAMHVKGMEIPDVDPRGMKAWGLAYAVSTRGACHWRALPIEIIWSPEEAEKVFGERDAANRFKTKGKGRMVTWYENHRTVSDLAEICKFLCRTCLFDPVYIARLIYAVTGVEFKPDELLKAGERVINIEKSFNVREGYFRNGDTLPYRLLNQPLTEGPSKGQVVDLQPMLDEYYLCRGWDIRTSIPASNKLKDLGLEDIDVDINEIRIACDTC